jgi:hypothetical protein
MDNRRRSLEREGFGGVYCRPKVFYKNDNSTATTPR